MWAQEYATRHGEVQGETPLGWLRSHACARDTACDKDRCALKYHWDDGGGMQAGGQAWCNVVERAGRTGKVRERTRWRLGMRLGDASAGMGLLLAQGGAHEGLHLRGHCPLGGWIVRKERTMEIYEVNGLSVHSRGFMRCLPTRRHDHVLQGPRGPGKRGCSRSPIF